MERFLPHCRRLRSSCDFCTTSKLKCSQEKPACQRCVQRGDAHLCVYSPARRPGRRRRMSSATPRRILELDENLETEMAISTGTENKSDEINNTEDQRMFEEMLQPVTCQAGADLHFETFDSNLVDLDSLDSLSIPGWESLGDMSCPILDTWNSPQNQQEQEHEPGLEQRLDKELGHEPDHGRGQSKPQAQIQGKILGQDVAPVATSYQGQSCLLDLLGDTQCECSQKLSQLMHFVSIPRQLPYSLDVVFTVEQSLSRNKNTVANCSSCYIGSPYIAMALSAGLAWVLEHIQHNIRDNDAVVAPILTVGGMSLSKELSRRCSDDLVKRRMRRLVLMSQELALPIGQKKRILTDVVRRAALEIETAAERMYGMMEMASV